MVKLYSQLANKNLCERDIKQNIEFLSGKKLLYNKESNIIYFHAYEGNLFLNLNTLKVVYKDSMISAISNLQYMNMHDIYYLIESVALEDPEIYDIIRISNDFAIKNNLELDNLEAKINLEHMTIALVLNNMIIFESNLVDLKNINSKKNLVNSLLDYLTFDNQLEGLVLSSEMYIQNLRKIVNNEERALYLYKYKSDLVIRYVKLLKISNILNSIKQMNTVYDFYFPMEQIELLKIFYGDDILKHYLNVEQVEGKINISFRKIYGIVEYLSYTIIDG